MTPTAAGWHPDPQNPKQIRYWDGSRWTEHVAAPTPVGGPKRDTKSAGWIRRHKLATGAIATVALLVFIGVASAANKTDHAPLTASTSTTTPTPTPTPTPTLPPPEGAPTANTKQVLSSAAPQTALAAVALLKVKGRAPKTGYDRDLFGSGWVDTNRNGCDTRNDILARDLTGETFKAGTNDCVVLSGILADPYSGTTISFLRGNDTSNDVQIDHVVALSDAWQKGAQQWDKTKRVDFANNPLNLLAVDGPLNMQKRDGDAATWLPPNKGYRCRYVARQAAVKYTYALWVTDAEKNAMVGVLSTCPAEPRSEERRVGKECRSRWSPYH